MRCANIYAELTDLLLELALRDGVVDPQERAALAIVSDLDLRARACVGLLANTTGAPRDVIRERPAWLVSLADALTRATRRAA